MRDDEKVWFREEKLLWKVIESTMDDKNLHVVMYPWFALGHITSFLHLSNKLAERGHRISFFLPQKTQTKMKHFNLHPNLITFIPITVPSVHGLPPGTETTADVPFPFHDLLMTAMDLTQPTILAYLLQLQPHLVFFDFTHWLPELSRKLGIKTVHYCTISPATVGYLLRPQLGVNGLTAEDLVNAPPGFPPSSIKVRAHEARELANATVKEYGSKVSFMERQLLSFTDCDAICFKTCREMEGAFCRFLENQFSKQVILAGPVVPEHPSSVLEEPFKNFLDSFQAGKVVFCAFGSECILKKEQFQELLLGLEQTGLPFLAALKPPVESAIPEGFEERVKGKGLVYGGWIQQQLILKHPSVGCFVTHCGCGSLSEALVSKCQLVLLPNKGDQIINARLMNGDLKVGVEVEKGEEDGLFSREGVCNAIKAVMDGDSEVGEEVRANHTKWREFLLSRGLENSYLDGLVKQLSSLFTKP